jgi:hypothetical protein
MPGKFVDPSKKMVDRKANGPVLKTNVPAEQNIRSLLGYGIDPATGKPVLKNNSTLGSLTNNNPDAVGAISKKIESFSPREARSFLNSLLKGNVKDVKLPPTSKALSDLDRRISGRSGWGKGKLMASGGTAVGGAVGIVSNLDAIKNVFPMFDVNAKTPQSTKSQLEKQIENIAASSNNTSVQRAQLYDLKNQLPKEGVPSADLNSWFTRILRILDLENDKRRPPTTGK